MHYNEHRPHQSRDQRIRAGSIAKPHFRAVQAAAGGAPRDLVARLEADNFGILFENVGHAAVDGIAKRILRIVNEAMSIDGRPISV